MTPGDQSREDQPPRDQPTLLQTIADNARMLHDSDGADYRACETVPKPKNTDLSQSAHVTPHIVGRSMNKSVAKPRSKPRA